jgi:hypothetical protein
VKHPAHRAGLPGKEYFNYSAPLDPTYKAGLAVAPPVGDSPQLVAGSFKIIGSFHLTINCPVDFLTFLFVSLHNNVEQSD